MVRLYDLLALGQIETVLDIALERRSSPDEPHRRDLVPQLNNMEDRVETAPEPLLGCARLQNR